MTAIAMLEEIAMIAIAMINSNGDDSHSND
jgi:hypothetical protein